MTSCNDYNQYFTDIVDQKGRLVTSKCFDGKIYTPLPAFNVNNYRTYKNVDYYTWINTNFTDYAFPDEGYDSPAYNEAASYSAICESKEYSLKQQQKFAGRFFNTHTQTNSMLVYHGLGSGKTQTSIVIAEAFKFKTNEPNVKVIPGRQDARILIVVPAALEKQYYAEIIGKYEDNTIKSAAGEVWISGNRQYYTNSITRGQLLQNYNKITAFQQEYSTTTDSSRKTRLLDNIQALVNLNKQLESVEIENIHETYEIISHDTFLNRLFKIENGKYIRQPYLERLAKSNGLLIIDEIQNLISGTGTNYRRLYYALRYYSNPRFKTVFLTGTPIYDKPYEIGLLINLMRPRVMFPDGRDQFNEVFINPETSQFINQDKFKNMCSGYVSYFKGGNPVAYPYKKTVIMYHRMESYQYDKYKTKLIKEVEKAQLASLRDEEFFAHQRKENANTGIFNGSNQFCNIAFPEEAISTHVENIGAKALLEKNVKHFSKLLKTEAKEALSIGTDPIKAVLRKTGEYSTKFAKVAEMLHNCRGTCFVYSNFVYYGVEALSIVMENIGYKPFPARGVNGNYFVWKGEANNNPALVEDAKKAFNDPANTDGSVLKIMFGTQTVMEGVDFKNVNQIHILEPWWNDSRLQQVIARGIRLCSHRNLPAEERIVQVFIHLAGMGSYEKIFELEITQSSGITRRVKSYMQPDEPRDKNSGLWIFKELYVSPDGEIRESSRTFRGDQIVPGSVRKGSDQTLVKAFGEKWKGLDSRSVQDYMYERSLQKLSLNRQFDKVLKEVAIDCSINKNGNVVRLNEVYTPSAWANNIWELTYENYSTGEIFKRVGSKDTFTLDEIVSNESQRATGLTFENVATGQRKTLNKSLIVSENITCDKNPVYTFSFPKQIHDMTLNNNLVKYLLKMKTVDIVNFFNNVQFNQSYRAQNIKDPKLHIKLKTLPTRKLNRDREECIESLKQFGFDGADSVWDEFTLEQLKTIRQQFSKK